MHPIRLLLSSTALIAASSWAGAQVTTFTICGTINHVQSSPFSPLPPPWNTVAVGDPFSLVYTFDCAAADSDPSTTFGYYTTAMTSFTFTAGSASTTQTIPSAVADLRIFSGQPAGYDQYESFMYWGTSTLFFQLDDSSGTAFDGNVPRDRLPCCMDLNDFDLKDLTFWDGFGGPFGGSQFGGNITGCTTCYHPPLNPVCADFDAPGMDGWVGVGVGTALPTAGPSGAATDHYLESTDQSGGSYLESSAYAGDWLSLAGSGCAALEFDVLITDDGISGSPSMRPALVLSSTGGSPIQAAFRLKGDMTEPGGANPGWHHVVAPLAPVSFGALPSGPDGYWEMINAANASWDTLLSSIATIRFHNDFSSAVAEVVGYDNVCLTNHGCVCSGKRPQYATGAWPRAGSVAAATTDAGPDQQDPNDVSPFVAHVVDLTTIGTATAGVNFGPAFYHHPNWKKSDLGTVFGVALDGEGNVFVAHTSVYGYLAFPADAVGSVSGGAPGAIYKLDKAIGVPSVFALLPNVSTPAIFPVSESFPGIGDLAYDCKYDRLYASNFEDGKVYVYAMNGALAGTFDHGVPDNGAPGFAPLGERVWAVAVHAGRLYYSIWVEDQARPNLIRSNEIWSVALDATGFPVGAPGLAITLPGYLSASWSNPVAGIGFSETGLMLTAERTMDSDTTSNAHQSFGREYMGPVWTETANSPIQISILDHSTAGGADYEHGSTSGQRRWFTGDYLRNTTEVIYGLQGAPAINPSQPSKSVLLDLDQNVIGYDKLQIGDVKITCAEGLPAEPGGTSCAGDGMPFDCPCGNNGAVGHGCGNGFDPNGALLTATGLAKSEFAGGFGADTVQFQVTGVPNTPCLLFSGTANLNPAVFMADGLRCCGGSLVRLKIKFASSFGGTTFGYNDPTEKISLLSLAPAGANMCYQVWYRSVGGPCSQLSNLSNGYKIAWH